MSKRKPQNNHWDDTYTPHSIDNTIVNILQKRDKWNFGSKDKIFFFKELAYLSVWWVWLVESLKIIQWHTDDFAVKEIAKNILFYINEGKPLSYALSRLPDYFDEWDANIVKSWEKSWNLSIVLKSLADEYSYLAGIKNKYYGALMYPAILIVIAIGAVIGLFMFVLPQVFSIVATFPWVELPVITRILKSISDFLAIQWKPLLWIISLVVFILSIFFSTSTGKKTYFNILMGIPLLWKMTKYFYLVKRCRYMNIMFSAGMSYVETFQQLRDVFWVEAYQDMIERTLAGLQRGESIYDTLKEETELIPSNASALIKVGEESANLEGAIQNILHIYNEELNAMIDRIAKIIEPIMLVFIGWLVVVIALWVFGLIFQVMDWTGI